MFSEPVPPTDKVDKQGCIEYLNSNCLDLEGNAINALPCLFYKFCSQSDDKYELTI